MNKYFLAIFCSMSLVADTLAAANLMRTNSVENGQATTNYILDSPFLRVVVSPKKGGGITKLFFKKAKLSLHDGLSFTEQLYHHFPENGRIVEDFESLEQSAFTVVQEEVTTQDPKSISLTLSGQSGSFTNLQLIKTYRLYEEECGLYVEYRLCNMDSRSIEAGLWVHAHLRTVVPNQTERYLFFMPTASGITQVTHPSNKPAAEYYYALNPSLNWKAFIDLESKVGAAIVTDYAPLSCFRDWHELNGNRSSTDLVFRQHNIKPRQEWATTVRLFPFREMDRVDGVMNDMIAYEVNCTAEGMRSNGMANVSLRLAYPGTRKTPGIPSDPITLRCKLWLQSTNNMPLAYPTPASLHNTNTQILILQSTASFKAGATIHFSNTFRKPVDGTYNYNLELYQGTILYGQSIMPIAISDVAVTTNLVIPAMDTAKTGTECLKPWKMLYRKIPDNVTGSLKEKQTDATVGSQSETNSAD